MKLSLFSFTFAASIFSGVNGNAILPKKSCNSLSASASVCPSTSPPLNLNHGLHATLALRGGEVFEVDTLEAVEDIIMKASNEGKLVVIDFSATWCGPCKIISPEYDEFSELAEFSNVVFLKVDVDENPETAAKYSVSAMPTFLFIKRGEVVDKLMGANSPALKSMIAKHS
mmetsp:Transcript_2759/g.3256  ORF Transcript_2759/g.3256 Transcript_2759/m.3256 type:complete len:171 (-) Transcript_2759:71-583(-)